MHCELKIRRFVTNPIGENCYVVWDETLEAAIIDCGAWGEDREKRIADFIQENGLHPRLALQTHMHFDHAMGLHFLNDNYGLRPQCHALEQSVYEYMPPMVLEWFGIQMRMPLVPIGEILTDGQEIQFGNTRLQVLSTPGHTPGGLCFYFPEAKILFSGDTLFQGSIGRSDLPGGNAEQLLQSIRTKLLVLPNDITVYPGHGSSTTIGDERQMNPYL